MAEELESLGFPRALCEQAMQVASLSTAEERVDWMLANMDGDELDHVAPDEPPASSGAGAGAGAGALGGTTATSTVPSTNEMVLDFASLPPLDGAGAGPGADLRPLEYKMVIVVRSDLGMSAGKVASQSVHAALGCVRQCHNATAQQHMYGGAGAGGGGGGGGGSGLGGDSVDHGTIVRIWEAMGEKVVCLKGPGKGAEALAAMQGMLSKAQSSCVPCYAVCDAGRTEVEPGTVTCLAIGPDTHARIDAITGSLRLY